MTDPISELCALAGVHTQYRGFQGQAITVSRETQRAVLAAMGLEIACEADACGLLNHLRAEDAARPLPHELIVDVGTPVILPLALPVDWVVEAEGTGVTLAGGLAAHNLPLPALPLGIHRLRTTTADREHITWLLARPARAVQLEDHIPEARIWGVTAALYGLTDGETAQIGTYDLLGDYAAAMAGHGADFLGINPVHAMGNRRPDDVISPYSPSHRGFLNTWHCAPRGDATGDVSELVNYPPALRANGQSLNAQFALFSALPDGSPEKQAFRAFVQDAGAALHEFAIFEVVSARFGADWRDWPAQYRAQDAAALATFCADQARQITRIKWAQWQAEQQLSAAQAKAQGAGMRLGLYLDLAIGPRLGGAETWARDTSLVTGATLGAPPDPLGPDGQNWGLAPQSPRRLRETGYAGFSRLLRATMRHAGMIRIDHILGLMRCYWIPEGGSEGTYVSYPLKALLAIVAIESQRNNCIIVGEDLGLVPKGLRKELAEAGIYGLDVLQYMRTPAGGFLEPAKTRKAALCAFATHDTPTISGFFSAEDAQARHKIGGICRDILDQTRKDRARALNTLDRSDPVTAIHRQLARANASMVAIQLDDIAQQPAQQNLPGTIDSYPNWRLKTAFTVSDIKTSAAFARLGQDMAAQGRANLKGMEQANDLSDCTDHTY